MLKIFKFIYKIILIILSVLLFAYISIYFCINTNFTKNYLIEYINKKLENKNTKIEIDNFEKLSTSELKINNLKILLNNKKALSCNLNASWSFLSLFTKNIEVNKFILTEIIISKNISNIAIYKPKNNTKKFTDINIKEIEFLFKNNIRIYGNLKINKNLINSEFKTIYKDIFIADAYIYINETININTYITLKKYNEKINIKFNGYFKDFLSEKGALVSIKNKNFLYTANISLKNNLTKNIQNIFKEYLKKRALFLIDKNLNKTKKDSIFKKILEIL